MNLSKFYNYQESIEQIYFPMWIIYKMPIKKFKQSNIIVYVYLIHLIFLI